MMCSSWLGLLLTWHTRQALAKRLCSYCSFLQHLPSLLASSGSASRLASLLPSASIFFPLPFPSGFVLFCSHLYFIRLVRQ